LRDKQLKHATSQLLYFTYLAMHEPMKLTILRRKEHTMQGLGELKVVSMQKLKLITVLQ